MAGPQPELRAVFCEALDRKTPQEQAAYLDQACAGKPALRARVEALLRANAEASGFLQEPDGQQVATAEAPPVAEGPGTVIGPYKLLEQIGEGGFGVVYMAEQTHPVRRRVAVKVLKPGMDSRQVIARFEAERQALALMDHPHIARVLDAGETAAGRPYFVMELVRGVPITGFCDQNNLPVRERLGLFLSVCRAVQHAHQKGVIHRDLKPSNILVTLHDGTPVVKVIDFGIAKALGQQLTDKTLFTGFAQMIGTPLYMSPEQAELSGLDIDTRSDIYSLGVLLYELLTGTTPLDKERLRQLGYDELRRLIREEEPPKPSTRLSTLGQAAATVSAHRQSDPKKLCQFLRGELDWIVMKCLEKDRNRRYETANGLARDLERYLHDEPVEACPPSAGYRLRKFARRYKKPLATAAAFVALLVVGAVVSAWQAVRATLAEGKAREAQRQAETNLRKARQAVNDYFTLVSDQTLLDEPALEPFRKQLLQAAQGYYQDFVQEHGDDPELLAELAAAHLRMAILAYELGGAEDWHPPFQKCVDLMEEVLRRKPPPAAFDCFGTGICRLNGPSLFHTRNPDATRRTVAKARDVWEELVRAYPTVPALKNDLGVIYLLLGVLHTYLPEERVHCHGRACELWRDLTQTHPKVPHYRAGLAVSLIVLGESLSFLRHWPQAEESSRQGLEEARKLAAEFPDTPAWQELHAVWGTQVHAHLLDRAGRPGEAAEVHRRAAVGQESLMRDRPKVARYHKTLFGIRKRLGDVLQEVGHPTAAAEEYRQARALGKLFSLEDPDTQDLLAWFLATCPDPQFRDVPRALALAQQLVARWPERSVHWATLGAAHYGTGDYPAAVRALVKATQLPGSPAVSYGRSVGFFLAMCHWQLGNKNEARQWYDWGIAVIEKRPPLAEHRLRCAEAEKVLGLRDKKD